MEVHFCALSGSSAAVDMCVCVCVTVDSHATFAARRYTLVRDDPVSPHDWLTGKYVLYAASQRHFHGLEVYSDGAAILHNSCRRHEGITFAAAALSSLRVDARYKLVPISASAEDARGSDCLGGKFCDAAAADLEDIVRQAQHPRWDAFPTFEDVENSASLHFWEETAPSPEPLGVPLRPVDSRNKRMLRRSDSCWRTRIYTSWASPEWGSEHEDCMLAPACSQCSLRHHSAQEETASDICSHDSGFWDEVVLPSPPLVCHILNFEIVVPCPHAKVRESKKRTL